MKSLLVSTALGAIVTAFSLAASASEPMFYTCGDVDGVEEYRIGVDLEKSAAAFFDNDSTSVLPLKLVRTLESNPPVNLYIYEGIDAYGIKMRITYNETRKTASVTVNLGQADEQTMKSESGCKADAPWDL